MGNPRPIGVHRQRVPENGPRLGGAAALYSAGGVRFRGRDRNPCSPLMAF